MGLLSFVKEAGAFLFGASAGHAAPPSAASQLSVDVLKQQVDVLGIPVEGLGIDLQGSTATVRGTVDSQHDREVVTLAVGNTPGVAQVDDQLAVRQAAPAADVPAVIFYTVKKGDTLSAIAKAEYGDARKYPQIFDANKPMLKDPDRIYPGQVLRIPPIE